MGWFALWAGVPMRRRSRSRSRTLSPPPGRVDLGSPPAAPPNPSPGLLIRLVSPALAEAGLTIRAAGVIPPPPEEITIPVPELGLHFMFLRRRGTDTYSMIVRRLVMAT